MLNLFIRIIQTALDELEVDLSEITDVEIEPHPGESYWLNFDNGKYYACVNQATGSTSIMANTTPVSIKSMVSFPYGLREVIHCPSMEGKHGQSW